MTAKHGPHIDDKKYDLEVSGSRDFAGTTKGLYMCVLLTRVMSFSCVWLSVGRSWVEMELEVKSANTKL